MASGTHQHEQDGEQDTELLSTLVDKLVVKIEWCQRCETHQHCTKHKVRFECQFPRCGAICDGENAWTLHNRRHGNRAEHVVRSKYEDYYNAFRHALDRHIPGVRIKNVGHPRLGAFEISAELVDGASVKYSFSKIATKQWPNVENQVQKLISCAQNSIRIEKTGTHPIPAASNFTSKWTNHAGAKSISWYKPKMSTADSNLIIKNSNHEEKVLDESNQASSNHSLFDRTVSENKSNALESDDIVTGTNAIEEKHKDDQDNIHIEASKEVDSIDKKSQEHSESSKGNEKPDNSDETQQASQTEVFTLFRNVSALLDDEPSDVDDYDDEEDNFVVSSDDGTYGEEEFAEEVDDEDEMFNLYKGVETLNRSSQFEENEPEELVSYASSISSYDNS